MSHAFISSACRAPIGKHRATRDRVNVHGGAIALGRPIGDSGARVLATPLHALERRGGRFGAAALRLGGGNAVAPLVESESKR